MDFRQLWADVISSVASASEDKKDFNIIQLLRTQVSFDIKDNVVTFICASEYVYQIFPEYSVRFLSVIKRLTGNNDLVMNIVCRSEAVSSAVPAQGAGNQAAGQAVPSAAPSQSGPGEAQNLQTVYAPQASADGRRIKLSGDFSDPYGTAQAVPQSVEQPAQEPRENPGKFARQAYIRPEKTFENYVTDPENVLIYNIAQKVAAEPCQSNTNPFYIYGGSGLGKTHLLFAIANRLKVLHPEVSVVYLRAEDFMDHYIQAMSESRQKKNNYEQVHFQDIYTQHNVFIVDDIQVLVRSPGSSNAFFTIISDFLDRPDRQLILASDVAPGNLKGFNARLTSRFGSGICREIIPPSGDTRKAITLAKCREFHVSLPDSVVDYIAAHIRTNVREIEGAIKTLNSYVMSYGTITYDQAVKSLDSIVNTLNQTLTPEQIMTRVAKEFDVTVESLSSAERKKSVSLARSIAMTLCQELIPNISLNDIGRTFMKDHSSVHEAIKRTKKKIGEDEDMHRQYERLSLSLRRD